MHRLTKLTFYSKNRPARCIGFGSFGSNDSDLTWQITDREAERQGSVHGYSYFLFMQHEKAGTSSKNEEEAEQLYQSGGYKKIRVSPSIQFHPVLHSTPHTGWPQLMCRYMYRQYELRCNISESLQEMGGQGFTF